MFLKLIPSKSETFFESHYLIFRFLRPLKIKNKMAWLSQLAAIIDSVCTYSGGHVSIVVISFVFIVMKQVY